MRKKRIACLIMATALMVGSLSGCTKSMDRKKEDVSEWIKEEQFKEILIKLDEVMNLRYTGYSDIDFKENYSDVFSESMCALLDESFKNDQTYYDIEDLYTKNFNIWKKAVEADGGILNDDLSVTRIENNASPSNEPSTEEDPEESTSDYVPTDVFDGYDGDATEPTIGISSNSVNIVRAMDEYTPGVDVEENPMTSDLYNANGEKIWDAKTPEEIASMSEEDIQAFNSLMEQNNLEFEATYRGAVQEQLRIEAEKETYGMDTGDGDPDPDTSIHMDTIADMETSDIVEVVDGRHVIEWSNILKNFDRETNRLYFNVLGYQEYLDVTNIGEFPASAAKGNEDYKFERVDYELLDNKTVNVEYMSYYMGGLRYKVNISGEIKDNKLDLEANQVKQIRDIFR